MAGAALGASALPAPAAAGPFISFLSDILPVKEAQRAAAELDYNFRRSYMTFRDEALTRSMPPPPPDVPDAPGAELDVLAASDAALSAASDAGLSSVLARVGALAESEPRRLRGRAAAGLFETELLGSVTMHMASRTDSYPFRAYCRWRAYAEALKSLGGKAADASAAAAAFRAAFGQRLLASGGLLATAGFPAAPRLYRSLNDVERLMADLRQALSALVKAGLCTEAKLDVDDVLAEIWATGSSRELELRVLLDGDPLVDAQVLMSEEFAAPISPDPVLAALEAWFASGSGPGTATIDGFIINSRWRPEVDREAMVYVPKQRLLEIFLRCPK